ncbi:non-ribosomal peptide synthetase [Paracoccus cavernae]
MATAGIERAPMTQMQVGLLLESQLAGRPALNVLQFIVHFRGQTIDIAAMRQAWQQLTTRHDVLRTALDPLAVDGPVQFALPEVEVDFLHLDWTGLDSKAQDEDLPDWLAADRRQGIALGRAPNWRVRMIQFAPDHVAMVIAMHHAIMDGQSFVMLLGDLMDHYRAYRDGTTPEPKLAASPSFLEICRAIADQDLTQAQEFFRDHLAGFDEPNRLDPVFLARPAEGAPPLDGQSSKIIAHRLDLRQSQAIRDRARAAGATTANIICAAWGLVLARVSGRSEAVFGLTRAGRFISRPAMRSVGCLINTLPVRSQLAGLTLDQLLQEQRKFVAATKRFEQTPLAVISELAETPKDTPLFDSLVMFDRVSPDTFVDLMGPEGKGADSRELSQMATAMTLGVYDNPEMLIRLEYDPQRFDAAGMERLAGYVVQTLLAMSEAGDVPLAQIQSLPDAEIAALLAQGAPADPVLPAEVEAPLIDLFEAAAARFPDHLAVETVAPAQATLDQNAGPNEGLSYHELDRRANHLAQRLRLEGVQPGQIVGLALPRGHDYVVALLAVLKAEASFLPLDPDYPEASLQDMTTRSGAVMLLTLSTLRPAFGWAAIPQLALDEPAQQGLAELAPARGPFDPARRAYVIFTSGSTGRPKGVEIAQGALVYHARAAVKAFGLSERDRVLQFASLNFDISIEEILPSLIAGARLVLRSPEMAQSMPDFLAAMAHHRISVANLPTAFWHVLVAHLRDVAPKDPAKDPTLAAIAAQLRLMVVGGERVSAAALQRWRALFPKIRWMNGYGPTEATITSTLYEAQGTIAGEVPIGRATGAAQLYVLCPDGSLAPEGVSGELWIGGPLLANGYQGQPDQTAAVFRLDPFATRAGESHALPLLRIYRSGDRVSWITDSQGQSQLTYHGRADKQIKLRGYRIELSAIEALLEASPFVESAVVGLDQAGTPMARLLAWVKPRPEMAPAPQAGTTGGQDGGPDANRAAAAAQPLATSLHERLAQHLPAFMLPEIIPVAHLPQSSGGKIDMARLPRPARDGSANAGAGSALADAPPADEATRKVQAIFRELLRRDVLGPDQSFFDLGGNSLLSVRLMSLLERDFGKRLTLATLYQASTARQIAAEIARLDGIVAPNALVPIQPKGDLPPLFAVHIIGPGGDFFRPLAKLLGEDQPIYGLTLDLLDPSSPTEIAEIAAVYAQSLARAAPKGPVRLIAVSQGSYAAFELGQQLIAAGRDVAALYFVDAEGPGGRPAKAVPRSLRHYLSRLRHNFRGVAAGRWKVLRTEIDFRVERLRLRLFRSVGVSGQGAARGTTAHQAAIDLAIRSYRPLPYPREITVFRAAGSDRDTPEGLASGLGWAMVAPRGVRIIDTDGEHLTILGEPYVEELADRLREDIRGG